MQFPSRRARIALLAGIATLGIAGTASASTADYTTANDTLTVTVTGTGTTDAITCELGLVKFNGADPTRDGVAGATTGCAASVALIVNETEQTAANTNSIDLRGVTRAEWTQLASSAINMGGGDDTIFGTEFADTIDPGDAADTVHAHDGADTMIWRPGDDSDVMNGGDGVDTVIDIGGGGDETFIAKPKDGNPARVDVTRTIPANAVFTLDIDAEKLEIQGNDGNDTITGNVGLVDLTKTTMTGGNGDDALTGTDGADVMDGGPGNDSVVGAKGNDNMAGGDGDDVLTWNPGEGTDIFEGGAGNDTGVDNGGAGNEHFIVTAQGQRVTATRDNAAPFFLDMGTIETLDLNTNAGDDSVEVNSGLGALIKVDANLGDGNDTIKAKNGAIDVIDGAGGTDTATADANDQVTNVETLDNGAKPAKVTFKSKRMKVKGGKAKLVITCPQTEATCNGRAAILIKKKVVGSIAIKMVAGQTKTYKIKLNLKTRVKLAKDANKKIAATARVRFENAAGDTVTSKKKLKLVGKQR